MLDNNHTSDSYQFAEGIRLFNTQKFFEAHEVLEDVWREAPVAEKQFLQGLIQAAVAFHHHSSGNVVGARSLLSRAHRNLSGFYEQCRGIHFEPLLGSLARWPAALD